MLSAPKSTLTNVVRLLGKDVQHSFVDNETKYQGYPVKKNSKGQTVIPVEYRDQVNEFLPEQIVAMILERIKEFSSQKAQVKDCVIACSGALTPNERIAILDAARIAGLNPLKVIPSTTAVSLAYSVSHFHELDNPKNFLIIELGDSYFGSQVVSISKEKLQVKPICFLKFIHPISFLVRFYLLFTMIL